MKTFTKISLILFLVTMLCAGSLFAQTNFSIFKAYDLSDGLIAHYPLDNSAEDVSGNGNNGTNEGAIATEDRFGNANSAFEFNGTDAYINIGQALNGCRTVSFWFKPNTEINSSLNTKIGLIVRNTSNEYDEYTFLFSEGGEFVFGRRVDYTPSEVAANSTQWNANQWYHAVGIIDSSEGLKLFVDGVQQDETDSSYVANTDRDEYSSIGRWGNANVRHFNGAIDDVRIYDRALSNSEVQELYSENGWEGDKRLVAHYPLNGNAVDSSRNGNDGINHGATPTEDRFGNTSSAMEFDGSSYIDCGVDPISNNSSVTFTAWCYPTNTQSGYIISSGGQKGGTVGYASTSWNNQFWVGRHTENHNIAQPYFGNYSLNKWYFVAGVYNTISNKIKVYVNNEFIAESEGVAETNTNSFKNLFIGQANTGGGYFNGKIDDVRIYNYPLSKNEIDELYHENGWDMDETVTDIDGNIYKTVKIGEQTWMAENLKVTHYRNGDPIPNITDNSEWTGLSTGAYCAYDNDTSNVDTYGLLYNWYTVDDKRQIAPEGWHIPSDEEWKELEIAIGMSQDDVDMTGWRGDVGNKLKTESGWNNNGNGTNESGFSAIPVGNRHFMDGTFWNKGSNAEFWTSNGEDSYAWFRYLGSNGPSICRGEYPQNDGYSIRCVKDKETEIKVDQAQEGINYGFWLDDEVNRWQEFRPTLNVLTKVQVNFTKSGNPDSVIISITDSTGRILSANKYADTEISGGWHSVVFKEGIRLNTSAKYRIDIRGAKDSPSSDNRYVWRGSTTSTYDSTCINSVSSSWPEYDFAFRTFGYTDSTTSIHSEREPIVSSFKLFQNYPNPFNPKTTINFKLPIANYVELKVYNSLGQKVKTLVSQKMSAGLHSVNFDGSALSSGVYFYKITAGQYQQVKKMILIK